MSQKILLMSVVVTAMIAACSERNEPAYNEAAAGEVSSRTLVGLDCSISYRALNKDRVEINSSQSSVKLNIDTEERTWRGVLVDSVNTTAGWHFFGGQRVPLFDFSDDMFVLLDLEDRGSRGVMQLNRRNGQFFGWTDAANGSRAEWSGTCTRGRYEPPMEAAF